MDAAVAIQAAEMTMATPATIPTLRRTWPFATLATTTTMSGQNT